jgi:hypothetical protein
MKFLFFLFLTFSSLTTYADQKGNGGNFLDQSFAKARLELIDFFQYFSEQKLSPSSKEWWSKKNQLDDLVIDRSQVMYLLLNNIVIFTTDHSCLDQKETCFKPAQFYSNNKEIAIASDNILLQIHSQSWEKLPYKDLQKKFLQLLLKYLDPELSEKELTSLTEETYSLLKESLAKKEIASTPAVKRDLDLSTFYIDSFVNPLDDLSIVHLKLSNPFHLLYKNKSLEPTAVGVGLHSSKIDFSVQNGSDYQYRLGLLFSLIPNVSAHNNFQLAVFPVGVSLNFNIKKIDNISFFQFLPATASWKWTKEKENDYFILLDSFFAFGTYWGKYDHARFFFNTGLDFSALKNFSSIGLTMGTQYIIDYSLYADGPETFGSFLEQDLKLLISPNFFKENLYLTTGGKMLRFTMDEKKIERFSLTAGLQLRF